MVKGGRTLTAIAKALGCSTPTVKRNFPTELTGHERKPGNNPHTWTDDERLQILAMASYGIPYEEIAVCFGIGRSTLINHFGAELDVAQTKVDANVTRALVRNALQGNVSAQIFYLKARRGWSEKLTVEHGGRIEGLSDLDLEAAISELSPKAREGLRALISDDPAVSGGEHSGDDETLH